MSSGDFHQIITANALLFLQTQKEPQLRQACEEASLVYPESAGAHWALKIRGLPSKESFHPLAGIDMAFQLCEIAAQMNKGVYFLGGKPGLAEKAMTYLSENIPNLRVSGFHHGFFSQQEEAGIIHQITQSQAGLVLVGMGMPFQDLWIYSRKHLLPKALYIGIGGTFDIWSGNLKRAPKWVQKQGLEWLYRFWLEPWRWRRMAQLPLFVYRVLREKTFGPPTLEI
ncbi:MAG: N-acetylglucosaminyldiphosphoundecaprenol N-acetyl-beta-D-mannosaminyltransferase [Elusimicrobia bacterium]|nr:N-acetylglucosaminyldiphosphoundecaprenol N-acetyl-beta-D-mannosaminyltransferase [Elusimicrobiota bacterium]